MSGVILPSVPPYMWPPDIKWPGETDEAFAARKAAGVPQGYVAVPPPTPGSNPWKQMMGRAARPESESNKLGQRQAARGIPVQSVRLHDADYVRLRAELERKVGFTNCPDCKGTRVYVGLGFFPAEPCRTCTPG